MLGRKKAFTLVELLVVIAIIAVLIGILLPTLGRARFRAQLTACQNQVRQIMVAVVNYCNDNKGFLPEYYGYNKQWNLSEDYSDVHLWGLLRPGDLNLDVNPPIIRDVGLGRLIVRKYLSTPKILLCPGLPQKINMGPSSSDRGAYFFNPHPAGMLGVWPNFKKTTTRFKKLRDYDKPHGGLDPNGNQQNPPVSPVRRAVVADFVYDLGSAGHIDARRRILWMNLGYPDGSVKSVESRHAYGRLAGGTSWMVNRTSDIIGLMEYIADGKIRYDANGNPIPPVYPNVSLCDPLLPTVPP